jgi:hypothetical protein
MNRIETNKLALSLAKKAFQEKGFRIEESSEPDGKVDFLAFSSSSRMKIKVRGVSQIGSAVNVKKLRFNIGDPDLYMVVLYLPIEEAQREIYVVPAAAWGKGIYPFKGRDYTKPGQELEPEWAISFSQKAKDAMEPYRFSKMI